MYNVACLLKHASILIIEIQCYIDREKERD